MMFLREGFNESFVNTTMSIAGIFTDKNLDATDLTGKIGEAYIANRRRIAEKVERDGQIFYRYNIITSLNHGLARQEKPLPSGIPIQLTFSRADATKSLIQIQDDDGEVDGVKYVYTEKTVPILNPVLTCYFVESTKANELYSKTKMYDVNVNFLEASLRRELLMNNVAEHQLKIFEGILIINTFKFLKIYF